MTEWGEGQTVLDEYIIQKELGRGGMGKVWLAQSNSTGRLFAIKQALVKDDRSRKDFMAELQTWIDLPEHPNILPCRFFRTIGDEIVIFTDFMVGGSLADWISKRKITTLAQILDVSIQFALGLHAIHERGLVHQDVKPGNVLMTEDGIPKVADFGLARVRLRKEPGDINLFSSPKIAESMLVSYGGMTPAYASPEQKGRQALSNKTDIWSWGISIMDMFTGGVSCPHGGHIALEMLNNIIENEQKEECLPELPEDVSLILQKCFAPDPCERWNSIYEAAEQLAAVYHRYIRVPYKNKLALITANKGQTPYVRCTDTGEPWSKPEKWLQVAFDANESSSDSLMRSSKQSWSRSSSAVSDIIQYEEAYNRLKKNVEIGNVKYILYLIELCYEKSLIYWTFSDFEGVNKSLDDCIKYSTQASNQNNTDKESISCFTINILSKVFNNRGIINRRNGNLDCAIDCYKKSINYNKELFKAQPEQSAIKYISYANTWCNIGIVYKNKGQYQDAISSYDAAIEVIKLIKEKSLSDKLDIGELDLELGKTLRMKGIAYRNIRDISSALACYNEALILYNALSDIRNDSDYLIEYANLCRDRAVILTGDESINSCKISIEIFKKLIKDYSFLHLMKDLGIAYMNLSSKYIQSNSFPDALKECEKSVECWRYLIDQLGMVNYMIDYSEARIQYVICMRESKDSLEWRSEAEATHNMLLNLIQKTQNPKAINLDNLGREMHLW